MTTCAQPLCDRDARAKGLCDTHYRRALYRERTGSGGIEPMDGRVFKVRVLVPGRGSQPFYYSKPEAAMAKVAEARKDGTLQYFAEYALVNRIV